MKKARKALLTLCAALLLVTMTAGVTIAYLTDDTEVVKNTFSVGNVTIDLNEGKVHTFGATTDKNVGNPTDENHGQFIDGDTERVKANVYKLIPGREYDKDPTVKIQPNSEDCYVFVKVDNGIEAIETKAENEKEKTIAGQMEKLGWKAVDATNYPGVYYWPTKLEDEADKNTAVVFNSFKIDGDAKVADYTSANISIQAYAVQADGMDNAVSAWESAPFTAWKKPAANP